MWADWDELTAEGIPLTAFAPRRAVFLEPSRPSSRYRQDLFSRRASFPQGPLTSTGPSGEASRECAEDTTTHTGTANATRPTRRATAEARPTVTVRQGSRVPSSRVTQVPMAWEARRSRANQHSHLPNHIASSGGRPGNTATLSNFGLDPFSSPSHRLRRPRLSIPLRLAHRVDIQAEACIQPSQPKLSRRLGCHLAT